MALERRRALPQSLRAAEEAALVEGFCSEVDLSDTPAVAGYSPTKDEIDCTGILDKVRVCRCKVLLPVCQAARQTLQFRIWDEKVALVQGKFGIAEPPLTAKEIVPDIVIVPLVAFDRHGIRVGYGGGYYDRTLHALRNRSPILALGLAFAAQHVDDILAEPTDEGLDGVLTGNGLTWFNENHVRRIPAQ